MSLTNVTRSLRQGKKQNKLDLVNQSPKESTSFEPKLRVDCDPNPVVFTDNPPPAKLLEHTTSKFRGMWILFCGKDINENTQTLQ